MLEDVLFRVVSVVLESEEKLGAALGSSGRCCCSLDANLEVTANLLEDDLEIEKAATPPGLSQSRATWRMERTRRMRSCRDAMFVFVLISGLTVRLDVRK